MTSTTTLLLFVTLFSCSQVTAGDQMRREEGSSEAGLQTLPAVQAGGRGREVVGEGVESRDPCSSFTLRLMGEEGAREGWTEGDEVRLRGEVEDRLRGERVSGLSGRTNKLPLNPRTKE